MKPGVRGEFIFNRYLIIFPPDYRGETHSLLCLVVRFHAQIATARLTSSIEVCRHRSVMCVTNAEKKISFFFFFLNLMQVG